MSDDPYKVMISQTITETLGLGNTALERAEYLQGLRAAENLLNCDENESAEMLCRAMRSHRFCLALASGLGAIIWKWAHAAGIRTRE